MTFSTPRVLAAAFQFTLLASLALVSSGCEDKHIGRPCDLGTAAMAGNSGTGNTATINSQSVECPSRICLSPAADKNVPFPLCTADCSSDDDCEGETGKKADKRCETGFACVVPTTVGAFCCRRLCVCKDNIETSNPDYNKTPEACKAGQSTCKNVN
jgi:hypothetical protein